MDLFSALLALYLAEPLPGGAAAAPNAAGFSLTAADFFSLWHAGLMRCGFPTPPGSDPEAAIATVPDVELRGVSGRRRFFRSVAAHSCHVGSGDAARGERVASAVAASLGSVFASVLAFKTAAFAELAAAHAELAALRKGAGAGAGVRVAPNTPLPFRVWGPG